MKLLIASSLLLSACGVNPWRDLDMNRHDNPKPKEALHECRKDEVLKLGIPTRETTGLSVEKYIQLIEFAYNCTPETEQA